MRQKSFPVPLGLFTGRRRKPECGSGFLPVPNPEAGRRVFQTTVDFLKKNPVVGILEKGDSHQELDFEPVPLGNHSEF